MVAPKHGPRHGSHSRLRLLGCGPVLDPGRQGHGWESPLQQRLPPDPWAKRRCGLGALFGVATLGLTTLLGAGILALYVGATVSLGVHSVGGAGLVADVMWYVPFEFVGLVMAATAGFQPAAGLARRLLMKNEPPTLRSFIDDMARSLGTLLIAIALIVLGAVIEAIVIQLKT